MNKRVFAWLLAVCMVFAMIPLASAEEVPTQAEAYSAMIALKEQYPQGSTWTNANSYTWNGGYGGTTYGCMAFANMLSDAAFGDLPARKLTGITIDDVRVGDILRNGKNTHTVIVLEVHEDYVVIAEGNYLGTVQWTNTMDAEEVASCSYMLTRYPEGYEEPTDPTDPEEPTEEPTEPPTEEPGIAFTDVPEGKFYYESVMWAVENGVTTGKTNTTFAPEENCTRSQIVTFLWRAMGEPEPTITENPFTDAVEGEFYYDAMLWAYENGITTGKTETTFDPKGECTRAQVVTFLWRAMGEPVPSEESTVFTDLKEGEYYCDAVAWAVETGVTTGKPETTFAPTLTSTRGEIVTFLYRAIEE